MRKTILLVVCVVFLFSLAACGTAADQNENPSQTSEAQVSDDEKGEVALVLQRAEHGWMAAITYYAEKYSKELGLSYKIYLSSNVNEQAGNLEDAIAANSSVVVLSAHSEEVSLACKKVVDAGIPLISFDREVESLTAYIGGDNYGLGVSNGTYICEKLGGEGIVALQSVPSVGALNKERMDGFYSVSDNYPDITVIEFATDGYQMEQGLSSASDLLTANPQIDAIASQDDESSLGFLKAIKDAGRTDIKYMSGCGGSQTYFHTIDEYKDNDLQLCTSTYSPRMIMDAIDLAVKVLDGGEIPEKTVVPTTLVDASNAAEFFDDDSPY
jgi:ribose transport system substrate-binding protein